MVLLTSRPKIGVGAATEDNADSLRLVVTQKGEVTLGTFVCKVAIFATFEAGDLVQSLETVRPAIAHGVHPVVALGIRHEGLAQLIHLLVFQLLGHFVAVRNFVSDFSTVVACYHNLLAHFRVHICWARQFKPGMGICAFRSRRAEPCQVVDAEHPAHMSVPAVWTMPTEPSVIPGTVPYFSFWINMQKGTLFVVAGIESGVEIALGHLGHVILVEELALIPLLTQAPQPMLADNSFVSSHMPVGTGCAPLTTRPHIKLADCGTRLVHPWEGQRLSTKLLG